MRYSFTNAKRLYNCSLWSPWSYFCYTFQHNSRILNSIVCQKREHWCQLFSHSVGYLQAFFLIRLHRSRWLIAPDCLAHGWKKTKTLHIFLFLALSLFWAVCLVFEYFVYVLNAVKCSIYVSRNSSYLSFVWLNTGMMWDYTIIRSSNLLWNLTNGLLLFRTGKMYTHKERKLHFWNRKLKRKNFVRPLLLWLEVFFNYLYYWFWRNENCCLSTAIISRDLNLCNSLKMNVN